MMYLQYIGAYKISSVVDKYDRFYFFKFKPSLSLLSHGFSNTPITAPDSKEENKSGIFSFFSLKIKAQARSSSAIDPMEAADAERAHQRS